MLLSSLFEHTINIFEAKARIEHPEDMIFDHGLNGAKSALQILQITAARPQSVSVKFDGCIHPDTVLLTTTGEKTIQNIIESSVEVSVLTHNFSLNKDEYNLAVNPRVNYNNKKWIEIGVENGSTLRVTEDHEVYTLNRGWVPARDLLPGDDIKESE